MGKSVCLSQPIGTVVALSSLSLWAKSCLPFLAGGRVMWQQVGLSFGPWCQRVPQGRAGGWWPKHSSCSALSRHRAPFRAARASDVMCHWLSK